jgi:hypothetical protein
LWGSAFAETQSRFVGDLRDVTSDVLSAIPCILANLCIPSGWGAT